MILGLCLSSFLVDTRKVLGETAWSWWLETRHDSSRPLNLLHGVVIGCCSIEKDGDQVAEIGTFAKQR